MLHEVLYDARPRSDASTCSIPNLRPTAQSTTVPHEGTADLEIPELWEDGAHRGWNPLDVKGPWLMPSQEL